LKIINGFPPNYRALNARFNIRGKPVFITYGEMVYVTKPGVKLQPQDLAHEAVHSARQCAMGVNDWWALYLKDSQFRLDEEVLGHRAEVRALKDKQLATPEHIKLIAQRLSSDLYGSMVTFERALKLIGG